MFFLMLGTLGHWDIDSFTLSSEERKRKRFSVDVFLCLGHWDIGTLTLLLCVVEEKKDFQ